MATSLYKAFIRTDAATLSAAQHGAAADIARDLHVSNALHLADEMGQVRVAYKMIGSSDYLTPVTPIAATATFYRIVQFPAWPALLVSSARAYRLRVRLAGYRSAANGTGITFRAVLSAPDRIEVNRVMREAGAGTLDFTTTATADADIDGTGGNLVAALDETGLAVALRERSVLLALAGSRGTVGVCMLSLTIFASTTNTSDVPRLTGVYAAEYVGT